MANSTIEEWNEAYDIIEELNTSPNMPDRRTFEANVLTWKEMYEDEEDQDDLVIQYLQNRLAALVRLTGDIGPARLISRPSETE